MFLQIILASTIGSIFALIGGIVLLWREQLARRFSLLLVSFAAGSLIGVSFLELIPEAVGGGDYGAVAPFIIVGILTIFLFEKGLHWYHCHEQGVCDYHTFSSTVLFGDTLHNFIDGVVIALSFSAGTQVGIATTIAVFFHEVPQEIGDFGVLLHAGYKKARILMLNFLTALATLAGAVLGYLLIARIGSYLGLFLAFAAGSFIYIAVSDLLPELRHKAKGLDIGHLVGIVLGIAAIWLVSVFLPE